MLLKPDLDVVGLDLDVVGHLWVEPKGFIAKKWIEVFGNAKFDENNPPEGRPGRA